MERKEVWNDTYRGVGYKIVHWQLGWNYYLYLPLEQIPVEFHSIILLEPEKFQRGDGGREHIMFHYNEVPLLTGLDWHGGITFYEKHFNQRGGVDGIKLGCDYIHAFDEGRAYNRDGVAADAKHTIDCLHLAIPNLKVRCVWTGRYYPLSEIVTEGGDTYSKQGLEQMRAAFPAPEGKEKA